MTFFSELTVVENAGMPKQEVDQPRALCQLQVVFALIGQEGADVDPEVLLVGER